MYYLYRRPNFLVLNLYTQPKGRWVYRFVWVLRNPDIHPLKFLLATLLQCRVRCSFGTRQALDTNKRKLLADYAAISVYLNCRRPTKNKYSLVVSIYVPCTVYRNINIYCYMYVSKQPNFVYIYSHGIFIFFGKRQCVFI